MIIPALILASAMQFADPQSGADIHDLQMVPWVEAPMVAKTEPTSPEVSTFNTEDKHLSGTTANSKEVVRHVAAYPTPQELNNTGYRPIDPNEQFNNSNMTSEFTPPSDVPLTGNGSLVPTNTNITAQPAVPRVGGLGSQESTYPMGGDSQTETILIGKDVRLSRSLVQYDRIAKLGAPVGGTVMMLKTPRYDESGTLVTASNGSPVMLDLVKGVQVFKGQELTYLDDHHPQAQLAAAQVKLDIAKQNAEKDIEIRYAESELELAEKTVERNVEANRKAPGAISSSEMDLSRLSVIKSKLQVEKSKDDQTQRKQEILILDQEVKLARTQVDLRRIKAPFHGMVVNVHTQEGNYLREGELIAEVAQLDKLKVLCKVDGSKLTQEMVDKKQVTVTMIYPNNRTEKFDGYVRFADPSYDSRKQFDIEIEVNNRIDNNAWLLKNGASVDVVVHLE